MVRDGTGYRRESSWGMYVVTMVTALRRGVRTDSTVATPPNCFARKKTWPKLRSVGNPFRDFIFVRGPSNLFDASAVAQRHGDITPYQTSGGVRPLKANVLRTKNDHPATVPLPEDVHYSIDHRFQRTWMELNWPKIRRKFRLIPKVLEKVSKSVKHAAEATYLDLRALVCQPSLQVLSALFEFDRALQSPLLALQRCVFGSRGR